MEKYINVIPGKVKSRCHLFGRKVRGCKSKQTTFIIFGDDGRPYSSRCEGRVCDSCLPNAIRNVRKHQTCPPVDI